MPISLNFELNDRDLEHFHTAMDTARKSAEGRSAEEIVDCAGKLLIEAQKAQVPDFIMDRLLRLDDLIAMVRDQGWALPDEDRKRVLSALVYFCDPADVIPDHVQVLGYLDDAVMIELCVRDLKHELDAYNDFCDYRQREATQRGMAPEKAGRADWLDGRREELIERMHGRRERDVGGGYGRSSGYASSKRSYARAWRPGLFRAS